MVAIAVDLRYLHPYFGRIRVTGPALHHVVEPSRPVAVQEADIRRDRDSAAFHRIANGRARDAHQEREIGNVTNFPLLVRITGSTICDAVEGSGVSIPPDIRFLDGDGTTWLNYVVERWSRNTDSAEVWVQVPQIDGNSDHDYITLYYNSVTNGTVPDGQCGACVFGSSNGFTGTWHMD